MDDRRASSGFIRVVFIEAGGVVMLIVRAEQMQVFEVQAAREFEDQMVAHVQTFAPRLSEVVGEEAVRETVKRGVRQARRYGFTNRGPVRFYIESMVSLGSDFDTDPQLPGVPEILEDRVDSDQMARADRLFERIHEFYVSAMGPRNEYGIAALHRIANANPDELIGSDGPFPDRVLSALQNIYPQKFWFVGEARLRILVDRGVALADTYASLERDGYCASRRADVRFRPWSDG